MLSLKNLASCPRKILYPSVPSPKPYLPSLNQRLASSSLVNFVFELEQRTHSYLSNYIPPVSSFSLSRFISLSLPVARICTQRRIYVNIRSWAVSSSMFAVLSVSPMETVVQPLIHSTKSQREGRLRPEKRIPMHKYVHGENVLYL